MKPRGFTLVELLVVVAIIGMVATLTTVAVQSSRVSARDAKRMADIRTVQKALELYYNDTGTYPPGSQVHDCAGAGGFRAALAPLVAKGYLGAIPDDPLYPNNPWPVCYFYWADYHCGVADPPGTVRPYILIFATERNTALQLPSWDNAPNRYCVYSQ